MHECLIDVKKFDCCHRPGKGTYGNDQLHVVKFEVQLTLTSLCAKYTKEKFTVQLTLTSLCANFTREQVFCKNLEVPVDRIFVLTRSVFSIMHHRFF